MGVVLGLLLWILLPVSVFGWLIYRSSQTEVEQKQRVWVSPMPADGSISTSAGLVLEWADSPPIVAPAWSGLIQRVSVRPGDQVKHGTEILMIDGIRRLAWQTETPFSKFLSVEDVDSEVGVLNDALASLGYNAPKGNRFSWDTVLAVRAYAKDIGVAGYSTLNTFDPAWVIYLSAPMTAGALSVSTGVPAPGAGEEIVTGGSALSRAVLVDPGLVESISADEDENATIDLLVPSSSRVSVPEKGSVRIGKIALEPGGDARDEIAAESLPLVQSLVAAETRATTATIDLEAPDGTWVLPASAVFVDPAGATCVLTKASGGAGEPLPVVVIASTDADVVVEGGLEADMKIGVYVTGEEARCG